MSAKPVTPVLPDDPAKPISPGRPKDLGKRAAILDAAKQMFTQHGFDGASMDQIAAMAGVSKLTVYSHFGDKDALFGAAVKAHCDMQLPTTLFDPSPQTPLRERLLSIAAAFYAMVSSPEAIAGHRILCTPRMTSSPLPRMFWEAGPERVQEAFSTLLRRRVAAGQLAIDDVPRAASQFFALLKGEPHARMVFGCAEGCGVEDANAASARSDRHIAASVDMFLRAYAAR
ncbi:MAG: TetR/AcrR family transcriptional regulator [Luteimonas sp.]